MSVAPLLEALMSASAPEQSNPAFNAKKMTPQDYLDHLNDSIDPTAPTYSTVDEANEDGYNIPTSSKWLAQDGSDVTQYRNDSSYGAEPMKTPGFWQRFANPQGANREIQYNTEYNTTPGFAQQHQDVADTLAKQHLANIPSVYNPTGMTPDQMLATGYTGHQTPAELNQEAQSALTANAGGNTLKAASDVLGSRYRFGDAKFNLSQQPLTQDTTATGNQIGNVEAHGELGREGDKQATLSQEQLNQLQRSTGVEPQQIELAHQQLKAELGMEPKTEELREYILKNQLSKEQQMYNDASLFARTSHNEALAGLRGSENLPTPTSPISIGPNGNLKRTQGYVSPITAAMAMQGKYPAGMDQQTAPIGNGLHVGAPISNSPAASTSTNSAPIPARQDLIPAKSSLRNIKELEDNGDHQPDSNGFTPLQYRLWDLLRHSAGQL